ncbi:hypothetical protein GCM10027061_25380 [Nesterenkonia suensis]
MLEGLIRPLRDVSEGVDSVEYMEDEPQRAQRSTDPQGQPPVPPGRVCLPDEPELAEARKLVLTARQAEARALTGVPGRPNPSICSTAGTASTSAPTPDHHSAHHSAHHMHRPTR